MQPGPQPNHSNLSGPSTPEVVIDGTIPPFLIKTNSWKLHNTTPCPFREVRGWLGHQASPLAASCRSPFETSLRTREHDRMPFSKSCCLHHSSSPIRHGEVLRSRSSCCRRNRHRQSTGYSGGPGQMLPPCRSPSLQTGRHVDHCGPAGDWDTRRIPYSVVPTAEVAGRPVTGRYWWRSPAWLRPAKGWAHLLPWRRRMALTSQRSTQPAVRQVR